MSTRTADSSNREEGKLSVCGAVSEYVCMLYPPGISTSSQTSYQVDEVVKGRLLKVRATFGNFILVFICVYIPTAPIERMLFLNTLFKPPLFTVSTV